MTDYVAVATVAIVLLAASVLALHKLYRRQQVLKAVIELGKRPVLVYDERGRLVFHSSGLVVFDREARRQIQRLSTPLAPNATDNGDMVIDGNRYHYRSQHLELSLGRRGTVLFLEYQGSKSA